MTRQEIARKILIESGMAREDVNKIVSKNGSYDKIFNTEYSDIDLKEHFDKMNIKFVIIK